MQSVVKRLNPHVCFFKFLLVYHCVIVGTRNAPCLRRIELFPGRLIGQDASPNYDQPIPTDGISNLSRMVRLPILREPLDEGVVDRGEEVSSPRHEKDEHTRLKDPPASGGPFHETSNII